MYNFLAATALTLPVLIFLRRVAETRSAKALATMSVLAWLAFLAHPFAFFVLPIAWLWLAAGRRERPDAYMWGAGGVLAAFLLMGFALPMVSATSPTNPYVFKPPLELVACRLGLGYWGQRPHRDLGTPGYTPKYLLQNLILRGGGTRSAGAAIVKDRRNVVPGLAFSPGMGYMPPPISAYFGGGNGPIYKTD